MKHLRQFLAIALLLSGCATVPELAETLQHGEVHERLSAARKLCRMGERAKNEGRTLDGVTPALIGALKDRDQEIRLHAVCALRTVAPEPDVLPALQAAARDGNARVRWAVILSLGIILGEARLAVVDRSRTMEEEKRLLFSPLLGDEARGAVEVLAATLGDESSWVRQVATMSLAFLGPDAAEAVPAIIERARKDESGAVRAAAAYALGMQGPDAKEARSVLAEMAEKDPSPEVREWASEMLKMALVD